MRIVAALLFQLVSYAGFSQDINITIKNIKTIQGAIIIDIYENKSNFLKRNLKSQTIAVDDMEMRISFKDVKSGEYAIGVIHDINDNGKLDTNFIGIPKEPIGTSNNPKPRMGPPKWDDAKFVLSPGEKKIMEIKLQYD